MELIKNVKILNFSRIASYVLPFSAILLVACFSLLFLKGFVLGIDFAGGSVVQIKYDGDAPITQVRDILSKEVKYKGVQVSEFGAKDEIVVRFPSSDSSIGADMSGEISSLLKDTGRFEIRRVDIVGPKVGSELRNKGILSLSLALLAILIYVSFRYEWRFAVASIVALFHDVVITATSVIVFNIDLNLEVVAALLTIIGYSINDTIIIFDRIREQMGTGKKSKIEDVINEAVSKTLSRTFLTSVTVFFVVMTLYIFGGDIIVGFSLPMVVGIIVGTSSSIFIAPKIAILLGFNLQKWYEKEAQKAKKKEEKKRLRDLYEKGRV